MHPATISLMYDQVRAIYRAVTGRDMPEPEAKDSTTEGAPEREQEVAIGEVANRFAELESVARTIPAVAERVPPFSFAPPLDAFEEGSDLIVEVAVPGVDRSDVTVERLGNQLVVSGMRRGERASNGRSYLHAEIPRGPFHRVIQLPYPVTTEPRVDVRAGLIRIQLTKIRAASA
jgi:HSP20 family molecular chaperone IbpA